MWRLSNSCSDKLYSVDGKKIMIIALSHNLYLYGVVYMLSTLFVPSSDILPLCQEMKGQPYLINKVLLNKSILGGDQAPKHPSPQKYANDESPVQ